MLQDFYKTHPKGFFSYINERRIIRDHLGPLKKPTCQIVTTDNDMTNTLNTLQFSVHPRTTEQHSTAIHICRQHTRRCAGEIKPTLTCVKSTGPDLLHPRVLLTLEYMLCGSLNHIFNKSAEIGIIPEDWKFDNVTAIHTRENR